jgi:predicted nucleic acid-binding protein
MFLLDTDVLSQRPKARPNATVMSWMRGIPAEALWISAITIEEVRFGVELLDPGRRRREIEAWLEQDILIGFRERIIPVDGIVADTCGRLVAKAKREKHNPDLADALIAATAVVHRLTIATLNRDHFERLGVELVEF